MIAHFIWFYRLIDYVLYGQMGKNKKCRIFSIEVRHYIKIYKMEGEGFEPSKAEPTDLQSVPFGRSGTPPDLLPTHVIIYTTLIVVNYFFKFFLIIFRFLLFFLNTALIFFLHAAKHCPLTLHAGSDPEQFLHKIFLPDTD